MQNRKFPQQLKPREFLRLLSNSFHSTFILNTSRYSKHIPNSLQYTNLLDENASRRRTCTTVVYDDDGLPEGFANIVALSIAAEGFGFPVYFLAGGIFLLEQIYPSLVCNISLRDDVGLKLQESVTQYRKTLLQNLEVKADEKVCIEGMKRELTKSSKTVLKKWFLNHQDNPYPTAEEKILLIEDTHLPPKKLDNWFKNARRKLVKG